VNFLYDDIVHVLQNTIDSCINSATDRRGYVLERMFTKFSEITLQTTDRQTDGWMTTYSVIVAKNDYYKGCIPYTIYRDKKHRSTYCTVTEYKLT